VASAGQVAGAVLNVAKLSPSGYEYYLLPTPNGTPLREQWIAQQKGLARSQAQALGRSIATEDNGTWIGAGLGRAAFHDEVSEVEMQRLFTGKHPLTGDPLRSARDRNRVRIAAFDLTFCAPKSLSVVHALAQSPMARAVREAHELACQAALSYAEESVFRARRRSSDQDVQLPIHGVMGAAFLHRTSRSLDPHLHSHVVVANLAEGMDGKWSALDARDLYRQMRTLGLLYQAHLRFEATRRLGVSWREVIPGIADVNEVPREVVELFSKRSREMRSWLEQRGLSDRSRKTAFFATRAAKSFERSWDELREDWHAQARGLGWEIENALSPRGLVREYSVSRGLASQFEAQRSAATPDLTQAKALILERLQEECEARRSRQPGDSTVDDAPRPRPIRDPHEVLRACCAAFPEGIQVASAVSLTKLLLENGILQEVERELAVGGGSRPLLARERHAPLASEAALLQPPTDPISSVAAGHVSASGANRGVGRAILRDVLLLREQDVARAAGVPFVGIGRAEAAARVMGLLDEEIVFPDKDHLIADEPRRTMADIGKELESLARELQSPVDYQSNGPSEAHDPGLEQEEKLKRYSSLRKEYLDRALQAASSRTFSDPLLPSMTESAPTPRIARLKALWRIAEASHAERWGDGTDAFEAGGRTATRVAHKCFVDGLRNDLQASLDMAQARELSMAHEMVRAKEPSKGIEREKFRSSMEELAIELYR
jgi:conjugative relaxase-like TrwC/TraI family protein